MSSRLILTLRLDEQARSQKAEFLERNGVRLIVSVLSVVSVLSFLYYLHNGLGLAYNDARSHLDIGRRVVEGLNTGAAQLGSVWLPLTHLLMTLTIWSDFMWHSGLAGALQSMSAFVGTGVLIYLFLKEIGVGLAGRFVGVAVFAININVLYLQSTAMTELMLLGTMTAGAYYLLLWYKSENILFLIHSAFWIMLSTLVRYDGWFLFAFAALLVGVGMWRRYGYRVGEGATILFCTLAGFGIVLWFLWNLLIFKDPLYFAFGPYSAHAQQDQLDAAGVLPTKGQWATSFRIYLYAMAYNVGALTLFLGVAGAVALWLDRSRSAAVRVASTVLIVPFLFNVLALYLGHSVLYIQGLSGESWFNVRYGIMVMPSVAVFVGYLADRTRSFRPVLFGLLGLAMFFSVLNGDAVTIDDARTGSSQKNVTEISGWLYRNALHEKGFILISAASHDSIIFSSGLPMKRFIHEGAGVYYTAAIAEPDKWARYIVVRSYSDDDSTWRAMKDNPGFQKFELVDHYPFADIYRLKPEYVPQLITDPILKQK
jgi:hypothetical protein